MEARIRNVCGYPRIEINGKLTNNTLYRSFRPTAENIRRFYDRGVKLFNVFPSGVISALGVPYSQFGEFWIGDGKYDFDVLRRQIDLFCENAPDAYFSLMIQFDCRDWYIKSHEDAVNSFESISDMAGDREWREAGKKMLADVIDFINREYPERFYAIHLAAGGTCEWLQRTDPQNLSPLKARAYRKWKGDDSASLCTFKEAMTSSKGYLFDPEKDEKALDFWRFHSEIISDTICEFAQEAKRLAPNLLTGVFFGYFYYAPAYFGKKGHSDFRRVVECPYIDMIFSPASYSFRTTASVSASQSPVDSVTFRKKLFSMK